MNSPERFAANDFKRMRVATINVAGAGSVPLRMLFDARDKETRTRNADDANDIKRYADRICEIVERGNTDAAIVIRLHATMQKRGMFDGMRHCDNPMAQLNSWLNLRGKCKLAAPKVTADDDKRVIVVDRNKVGAVNGKIVRVARGK